MAALDLWVPQVKCGVFWDMVRVTVLSQNSAGFYLGLKFGLILGLNLG